FISYGASTGQGAEGTWVDQRGSFMAAVAAGPVYELLGEEALPSSEFPAVGVGLVDGDLAWGQHAGGHTTGPDWPKVLSWAGRFMSCWGRRHCRAANFRRWRWDWSMEIWRGDSMPEGIRQGRTGRRF